jgi:ankyrin repeat protein
MFRLHWAAQFGLCEVAKKFLRTTDADKISAVNATDSRGHNSIMYAAQHGHYGMAKILLERALTSTPQFLP